MLLNQPIYFYYGFEYDIISNMIHLMFVFPSGEPEFTACFSVVCVALSLVLCALFCRSLFVPFLLVIALSVRQFTTSYYSLVSANTSYVLCSMTIYKFISVNRSVCQYRCKLLTTKNVYVSYK